MALIIIFLLIFHVDYDIIRKWGVNTFRIS